MHSPGLLQPTHLVQYVPFSQKLIQCFLIEFCLFLWSLQLYIPRKKKHMNKYRVSLKENLKNQNQMTQPRTDMFVCKRVMSGGVSTHRWSFWPVNRWKLNLTEIKSCARSPQPGVDETNIKNLILLTLKNLCSWSIFFDDKQKQRMKL